MTKPWALVTGAAKRIGKAIALDLAKTGWNIAIHYHTSQKDAVELAQDLQKFGAQTCLIEIDLAQTALLAKLLPALTAEIGPLEILVNNASLFEKDTEDPEGQRHRAINFEAPRILSESFHALKTNSATKIIINLLDSDPTKQEFIAYNKSKIDLRQLTLEHSLRFAPQTCVHGLALGPILPSPRESQNHFDALVEHSPLKRRSLPEDIARAVRFLVETPSMTGNILYLDGGIHLGGQNKKISTVN